MPTDLTVTLAITGAITGVIGCLAGLASLGLQFIQHKRDRYILNYGYTVSLRNRKEGGQDCILIVWFNNSGREPIDIEKVEIRFAIEGRRKNADGTWVDIPVKGMRVTIFDVASHGSLRLEQNTREEVYCNTSKWPLPITSGCQIRITDALGEIRTKEVKSALLDELHQKRYPKKQAETSGSDTLKQD